MLEVASLPMLKSEQKFRSIAGKSECRQNHGMANLLIIEDEPALAQGMSACLHADGWLVQSASSAEAALPLLRQQAFDLLVLDVMLPGMNGFDLLAIARQRWPSLLVLMVTARDGVADRVRGLRAGADDYLVKPFASSELAARVDALLRRSQPKPLAQTVLGPLQLDTLARQAWLNGVALDLAPREFDLLAYLMRHAPRVVSRDMMARDVWRATHRATPLDNVIDVHITRLRRKLNDGSDLRLIHTLRGLGFSLSLTEP